MQGQGAKEEMVHQNSEQNITDLEKQKREKYLQPHTQSNKIDSSSVQEHRQSFLK